MLLQHVVEDKAKIAVQVRRVGKSKDDSDFLFDGAVV
jgi:hypothetical protein